MGEDASAKIRRKNEHKLHRGPLDSRVRLDPHAA